MTNEIDLHIGKRARRRRRLIGLTQQQVGAAIGVTFQQVQKLECGANKISAGRVWHLSQVLEVPVGYFYDGLQNPEEQGNSEQASDCRNAAETQALIDAYYGLPELPRKSVLELMRSLQQKNDS